MKSIQSILRVHGSNLVGGHGWNPLYWFTTMNASDIMCGVATEVCYQ